MYPKLRSDFVSIRGRVDAVTVLWINHEYKVATNLMIIKWPTSPATRAEV
ncbi:hypothetical protein SPRG_09524 [Saprolegnia parasitica CBS 223.65]|uniref:Uncharacterized protein n=1 Tax=Saprolegnia parasitica (strain CBS 223.65) TaxID=695850 RepID=A0A067C6T5_SAPPC|nr:hypothetical protein SPRG_09524 [Saprolegnia parasitica CBS 223.65]KDO24880.1 hypothetical protein SPRG_09524 [Saprolegnia parasitica CBS 223.65]|eukprot:XP_012204340.1 hypothetical protein SPRG_09524 [Saprolegnia parasitica CBS 223.65]